MHGMEDTKFIIAQQAKPVYSYRSIKENLLKTNASIWFNKMCIANHLTPRYIHITVNGSNTQILNTKRIAIEHRISQGLKFQYIQKQKLNQHLYQLHL